VTVVHLLGDPETVCGFIDAIIALGNDILSITKTKNSSHYVVIFDGVSLFSFLLMENGSYLLEENGGRFILE